MGKRQIVFFFSSRRRHTRSLCDWSSDVCSSDLIRALVVDAAERVLLMRFENPANGDVWWATPGGGIDEGETDEVALRRELLEEAGLRDFEPGPVVWVREHVLPWDRHLWRQRERFHLVHVERHQVEPTIDLEAERVYGHRWWTLEELEQSHENLAPRA